MPVGAERHTVHRAGVPGERAADGLAGVGVPHPHRGVVAGRGQPVPVGAKGDTGNHVGVPGERAADGLAGVGVPQPDRIVGAAGGQSVPIGAEKCCGVPVRGWDDLVCRDPLHHGAVQGAVIGGLGERSGGQQLRKSPCIAAALGAGQHALGVGDQPHAGGLAKVRLCLVALHGRVMPLEDRDGRDHGHDEDDRRGAGDRATLAAASGPAAGRDELPLSGRGCRFLIGLPGQPLLSLGQLRAPQQKAFVAAASLPLRGPHQQRGVQMHALNVGLQHVHQPRDIGIEGVLSYEGPVDVRQRRRNRLHRRIPDDHRDNAFGPIDGVIQFDTAHLRGHGIRRDEEN